MIPRRNSRAWTLQERMRAEEAAKPHETTNWSSPKTNLIAGMNSLRSALASGHNAKLEKRWNEKCAFPIRVNPNLPWSEQVSKKFKHKVWVVVLYYNHPKYKAPVLVHVLNALCYPLKYIPERSVLRMDKYKIITFRIGSVMNGYSIDIEIPKKFSFKN